MTGIMSILIMNRLQKIVSLVFLVISVNVHGQNHSYTILYDQVYPLIFQDYVAGKNMYLDLSKSASIDPSERLQFAALALTEGDVEFYKTEVKDLIRYSGYFFTYEDTLKSPAMTEKLKAYNLLEWLVTETNTNYPLWIKENTEAYFIQSKLLSMAEVNKTRTYYYNLIDYCESKNDSLGKAEVLTYLRDLDFNQLYTLILFSKTHGLPTNFDAGFSSYYIFQQILINNAYDLFNFKRTWHHIFPHLEKAYFDGKISNSFLKIYDKALQQHFGHQYYGTIEGVEITDPDGLAERRKKFGL
jgi:hypothetical protein